MDHQRRFDMATPQRLPEEDTVGGTRSVTTSSSSAKQSVTLKSSDVLDCPVCYEPLTKPIFQCANGHIACSLCCIKLRERCPFCRSYIGGIRCLAMETVIETTIVPCRNAIYGCRETISYGTQSSHDKMCLFVRCKCERCHM